jgi:hypothetical protein
MIDRTKKRTPIIPLADYGINEMWKFYKEKYDVLDEKTYKKVLKLFNKKVSNAIVKEAFEFIMPRNIGNIRIKKNKPRLTLTPEGKLDKKMLIPNWKETWKLWDTDPESKENKTIVYYENKHTDGYIYRWHYSKHRNNLKNKSAYSFIPSRTNKNNLTEVLKNMDDYPSLDYYC